jgi:hypothetical protein
MKILALLLFLQSMDVTMCADCGSGIIAETTMAAAMGAILGLLTAPIVLRRSRDWAAFAKFHEALARRR